MAMLDSMKDFGKGVFKALKIRKKIKDKRAGKKAKKSKSKKGDVSIGMAIEKKRARKHQLEKANKN